MDIVLVLFLNLRIHGVISNVPFKSKAIIRLEDIIVLTYVNKYAYIRTETRIHVICYN